jgi:hypothetical protein
MISSEYQVSIVRREGEDIDDLVRFLKNIRLCFNVVMLGALMDEGGVLTE